MTASSSLARSSMERENIEWCIMHPDDPDEPHRGPMAKEEAEEWISTLSPTLKKSGGFYIAARRVGEWLPWGVKLR